MGKPGSSFHHAVEHIESQWGGNEDTLFVAGALLGSELVGAVAGADRDGQRVAAGAGGEVNHFGGIGVGVVVGGNLVLNAGEHAELTFYGHVVLVCVVNYFLGESHVLLVGEVRAVDHNGGEAVVDAVLAELEAVAVVEVQHNLGMLPAQLFGVGYGTLAM